MIEEVEATGTRATLPLVSSCPTPPIPTSGWPKSGRSACHARAAWSGRSVFGYRHRAKNTSRKAGNIADFVTRWGGAYPQMVVLDADSLMTGHAIISLAAAMEADPDAGIIQTLPLIINRNTLFARVQQFAARIYGPSHRIRSLGLDGPRRQLLGPQRGDPHGGLCGALRVAGPAWQAAVRRPHPQPRLRRGRAHPARRLHGLHVAQSRGQLRGESALADRCFVSRSAVVSGQPPAHQDPADERPSLGVAPAFHDWHLRLSCLAALADAAARRHPDRVSSELYQAGVFHERVRAVSRLATVRCEAIARSLRLDHGDPSRAKILRPAHRPHRGTRRDAAPAARSGSCCRPSSRF